MKISSTTVLAALHLGAACASAQQSVLVPWNQNWKFMHPMGAFPDVPPGGDTDFETTWILPEAAFAAQYNGPIFGASPRQAGDPATTNSYDSGISQGPIGYENINYFNAAGAEFSGFGDDDANPGNGLAGLLSTPASGQRRAAYFRTTFTVPGGEALVRPKFRYLVDDGAYIYLDGELVAAVNMAATTPVNRDQYEAPPQVNAANSTATEDPLRLLDLSLAAGAATGGEIPGGATLAPNARIVKQILSLAPGQHTLAVSVRSSDQASTDLAMAFELSAEVGCVIGATVANVTRSNAGTPFNPADDNFMFEATVTAINGGASWTSNAPGNPGGAYNVPVVLGPFPIAQSPLTLTIAAISDPACTTQVTATAPVSTITATPQSFIRDLRGTVDPADDLFTAMVVVNSQFASATWNSTGTTPGTAVGGTPGTGSYGVPVTFGPYAVASGPITVALADAGTPAVTTQVVLSTPIFLGSKAINGVLSDLLSAAPLPSQWTTNGAISPTITMANAGGDIWREFRSQVVDLSSAGTVAFTAGLVARDTSATSNFESVDGFRAKLLLTGPGGPSEVNLIAPYDTNTNGMVNGVDTPYDANLDEFNLLRQPVAVLLSNVLRLEAVIPATATSAQLVVEGKGIATSEFFDVSAISFSDRCAFTAAATNIVRNSNGQPTNSAVHTASFTLRATPTGLVSAAGWNVTFDRGGSPVPGANVTGGAYNTDVVVTGLPADGGLITATLVDRGDTNCRVSVPITIPGPPSLVGRASLAGVNSDIYSNGPATNWTVIANGLQMTQAPAISDFNTETVDLSAVNGNVYFSMNLQAMETSTGSNFEVGDIFLAELLLSDGATVTTVNLITPHDRAGDGQMNGDAATLNLDDFNPRDQEEIELLDNTFLFSATIPDNIVSATLRLRARVDVASEFLRVRDVLFTTTPPSSGGDSDGDGVSDADELIAGTNPNSAASVFRVTTFTTSAGVSSAGFGTVSGRVYQGYTSTNLVTWTRDDANPVITGSGSVAAWPLPRVGSPVRFLRIAVAASPGDFPATTP